MCAELPPPPPCRQVAFPVGNGAALTLSAEAGLLLPWGARALDAPTSISGGQGLAGVARVCWGGRRWVLRSCLTTPLPSCPQISVSNARGSTRLFLDVPFPYFHSPPTTTCRPLLPGRPGRRHAARLCAKGGGPQRAAAAVGRGAQCLRQSCRLCVRFLVSMCSNISPTNACISHMHGHLGGSPC